MLSTISCVPDRGNSQIIDLFISGVIHTFHTIQLVRNSIGFNGLKSSLLAAKAKISTMVIMSGHALNGHCIPSTYDIQLLDKFLIPPSFQRFKDIEMIVWKPSTLPYIKVNTDASLRNANAACGGALSWEDSPPTLSAVWFLKLRLWVSLLRWKWQLDIIGGLFGLKVTPPVLSWLLPIRLWFRFGGGTNGIIVSLMVCRCSHLIYSAKEMVARTSLHVMVMLSQIWLGGMFCLSLFGRTFLGTGLGYLIFVFRNFRFLLRVLVWSPLLYIFFPFLLYILYE